MRQFIVKHFALNKTIKVFGFYVTSLRIGRWTMLSLLTLMGVLALGTPWGFNPIAYLFLAIFLMMIFFGFFYFNIWPVKWEELDDDQKLQAGVAVRSGQSTMKLTLEQWREWEKLYEKYNKKR